MGKTIRRKNLDAGDSWLGRRKAPDGVSDRTVSGNIFHSDKPKRWKGIDSNVKEDQNRASRSDKRKVCYDALNGDSYSEKTDKVYRRKANEYFKNS